MSTLPVIVLVLVLLVAVGVALAVRAVTARRQRTERLRSTFGPEYDRAVEGAGGRREAEQDLQERKSRHASLELRPLSESSRESYRSRWLAVQTRFVDSPAAALTDADGLITALMQERGYPTESVADQEELLSVQHAKVLEGFRAGHAAEQDSAAKRASTEQIRQGMLEFRTVFEELLDDQGGSRKLARD